MPNLYGAPGLAVREFAEKIGNEPDILVLDVREPEEIELAKLPHGNVVVVPLSELAARGVDALPEAIRRGEEEVVVMCHHGIRSAQVVAWLHSQGLENAVNLNGGIDAYASEIDSSVGVY